MDKKMFATVVTRLAGLLRKIDHFISAYRKKVCFRQAYGIGGLLLLCGCVAGVTGGLRTGAGGAAEAIPEQTLRFAPRIALVVGNSRYDEWPSLNLSGNDATAMAKTLTASGFTLIGDGPQLDVRTERFHQLLEETAASTRAHPGAIVVVYFSGHGFAPQGHNKLVPVDAPVTSSPGASSASIDVAEITRSLSASGSGLTILLLDACRDAGTDAGKFVDVPAPPRTFIGFSTYFGTLSSEGAGPNSRYTAALLEAMKSHWDRLGDLHAAAAYRVNIATGLEQTPVFRAAPGVAESKVRIALLDPESAYVRLATDDAAGGHDQDRALLAARCASLGPINLMTFAGSREPLNMSQVGSVNQFGPMSFGVPDSGSSISDVLTACRAAYRAGASDPATIRSYSIAMLLTATTTEDPSSLTEYSHAPSLLVQAADNGDGIAEYFVAMMQAGVPHPIADVPVDPKLAGARLIHAAESDDGSPYAWMVGLSLMKPNAGWHNADFDLPQDPARGFQIILHAARLRDPMALVILDVISQNPQIYGYSEPFDFRSLIRASLDQPPRNDVAATLTFDGLTVGQTLYTLAMLDAAGSATEPPDYPAYVRLSVRAEPWFPKFLALFKNPAAARIIPGNVGCALLGGIKSSHPMASAPHDVVMGRHFLQMAADAGNNVAQTALSMLRKGDDMPCSSNPDGWGVRPR